MQLDRRKIQEDVPHWVEQVKTLSDEDHSELMKKDKKRGQGNDNRKD